MPRRMRPREAAGGRRRSRRSATYSAGRRRAGRSGAALQDQDAALLRRQRLGGVHEQRADGVLLCVVAGGLVRQVFRWAVLPVSGAPPLGAGIDHDTPQVGAQQGGLQQVYGGCSSASVVPGALVGGGAAVNQRDPPALSVRVTPTRWSAGRRTLLSLMVWGAGRSSWPASSPGQANAGWRGKGFCRRSCSGCGGESPDGPERSPRQCPMRPRHRVQRLANGMAACSVTLIKG